MKADSASIADFCLERIGVFPTVSPRSHDSGLDHFPAQFWQGWGLSGRRTPLRIERAAIAESKNG